MLRTLLTERFKLAVHRESKEQPVYRLIVNSKAPSLKSDAEPAIPRYSMQPGGLADHRRHGR